MADDRLAEATGPQQGRSGDQLVEFLFDLVALLGGLQQGRGQHARAVDNGHGLVCGIDPILEQGKGNHCRGSGFVPLGRRRR